MRLAHSSSDCALVARQPAADRVCVPRYDDRLDVDETIRRVFPKADANGIRLLVERAQARPDAPFDRRVELACVLLSSGDLAQLKYYLEQAALDPRDVLYWAFEYGDDPPAAMNRFLRR
jgi:hypothetical protein